MSRTIRQFIQGHPIIDVHEHHMPETLLAHDVGLLDLFANSYAGWAKERPYRLPGEMAAERQGNAKPQSGEREAEGAAPGPAPSEAPGELWAEVRSFLEEHGSTAFVRNLLEAIVEIYEPPEGTITAGNVESLDAEIRRRHRDPDWVPELLRRAGIEAIVTDPFSNPLLNVSESLGPQYTSVMRMNAFALGWHPESRDHNGNRAHHLAARLGRSVDTFDDYLDLLEHVLDTMGERQQVGLKNALAYDRGLDFEPPNEKLARGAWGNPNPRPEERKAFGDLVVDRFCGLAAERGLPVQVHTGSGLLYKSQPMQLAGLVGRHPRTRFLLMHLGYPWGEEILGLGFIRRNVWLDLTWSWLISPSFFKRTLHEAIEVLPDESRMMIGGDNWHAEETYGSFRWARRFIGEVLEEKVEGGYFSESDAKRLGRKILHDNGARFFAIAEPLGDD